jgi:transposase
MQDRLREQWRQRLGRNASPSAAVLDAQSTRRSPQGGENGYDAGKKVKGRKRHLLVDTLGLLLAVTVTAASVQDRDGAPTVVAQACAKLPTLTTLYVDGAYSGQCAEALQGTHGLDVQVVRHPGNGNAHVFHDLRGDQPVATKPGGFVVLPKRWVVERTHAWNERCRRLVMHHDRKCSISAAWVWFAEGRLLAARLAATT